VTLSDKRFGEPAIFVSRSTAAARLEISVDTFDQMVRDQFLPGPDLSHGQVRRWHWPSIEARLIDGKKVGADPYMTGVRRAPGNSRSPAS
jgi:hypothetical protein